MRFAKLLKAHKRNRLREVHCEPSNNFEIANACSDPFNDREVCSNIPDINLISSTYMESKPNGIEPPDDIEQPNLSIQQTSPNGVDISACRNNMSKKRDKTKNKAKLRRSALDTSNEEANATFNAVIDELKRNGFHLHLASSIGGDAPDVVVQTVVRRLAELLIWTYESHFKSRLDPQVHDIILWFKDFIVDHYRLIASYTDYLESTKSRTPATVLHILNDIKKSIHWLAFFRDLKGSSVVLEQSQLDPIFKSIKLISKNLKMKIRHQRSATDTLASVVYSMKLPKDGLKGLIAAVRFEKQWVDSLMEKLRNDPNSILDKDDFDIFMQTLYAALYVFGPQGRVGGIANLCCRQGMDMLRRGYTQTNKFKTAATYGYQPVIIGDMSEEMLRYYIDHVRPIVSGHLTKDCPSDPLWLLFNGIKAKSIDISNRVHRFFNRTMHLNVTTNGIRKLMEIQAEKAKREGIITETEREAIRNVNGHSPAVCKDFYLKMDRNADSAHARNCLGTIYASIGETYNANALNPMESWEISDELAYAPWGTKHPSFEKQTPKNMRVPWSDAEIRYIENWIKKEKILGGNRVAKCLRAIKADENAIPIFHANHTLNSGRLRTGFDRAYENVQPETS